jgi:putative RNA 2'-phosphotransferase
VLRRLVAFARDWVGRLLAPLRDDSLTSLSPAAHRVLYALDHALGTVHTKALDDAPSHFTPDDRTLLASAGVVIGPTATYARALLASDAIARRATLCAAWFGRGRAPSVPQQAPGSFGPSAAVDPDDYLYVGYVRAAGRVVRVDVFDRVREACFAEGLDEVSSKRLARWLDVSESDARRMARAIAPDAPRSVGPNDIAVSKRLSYVLRHRPDEAGIQLDAQGWVSVSELLEGLARHGLPLSRERLDRIVAQSDKQRFAFSPERDRIRASQGHSVPVSLGYEPADPPALLYHGTAADRASSVEREGLVRGRRHDVHLSTDRETARRVGARRGTPVVFEVDAAAMRRDGHLFQQAANGVWLTAHVPPRYLRRGES